MEAKMPYRENATGSIEKLFYVSLVWKDPGSNTSKANSYWIRARDTHQAYLNTINQIGVSEIRVWHSNVISVDDFLERELEK